MDAPVPDSGTWLSQRCELLESRLQTLYEVSRVLSQTLEPQDSIKGLLQVLHDGVSLLRGMVALRDPDKGDLVVSSTFHDDHHEEPDVRYAPGEGVMGSILQSDQMMVLERIDDDPRFVDKLHLYDHTLPYIGVPIRVGDELVGVLAAQPETPDRLEERAHFLEMVANLLAQSVRLSRLVEKKERDLTRERDRLQRSLRSNYGFDHIVGHSDVMRTIFDQISMVSKWNTTVLIRGESGTGKELVANAIHYNSTRNANPFVKLNCAALTDNLLESELFGHEKGAFTGAVSMKKGRFEQANGGTLFLDEIGEVSAAFQAKLLRVLQEGEFERVGGTKTLKVDVRVIAATNRDLEKEVADGDFREDLYYRLNVMPIYMPALRERLEDVPELAQFLAEKLSKQQGRPLKVTDGAIRVMMQYDWPGNVRQLENCIERSSIMSATGIIDRDVINLTGQPGAPPVKPQKISRPKPPAEDFDDSEMDEREKLIAALEQAGWVQAKAARLLGMTPRQIAYRIQILDINVKKI